MNCAVSIPEDDYVALEYQELILRAQRIFDRKFVVISHLYNQPGRYDAKSVLGRWQDELFFLTRAYLSSNRAASGREHYSLGNGLELKAFAQTRTIKERHKDKIGRSALKVVSEARALS